MLSANCQMLFPHVTRRENRNKLCRGHSLSPHSGRLASSRSTRHMAPTTSKPNSRAVSMAWTVEDPVVQTSSTITTRAPFSRKPSIPGRYRAVFPLCGPETTQSAADNGYGDDDGVGFPWSVRRWRPPPIGVSLPPLARISSANTSQPTLRLAHPSVVVRAVDVIVAGFHRRTT